MTIASIERGRIYVRQNMSTSGRYIVGIMVREPSPYSGQAGAGVRYGDNNGVSQASVERMRQVYFNSVGQGRRVEWDMW
jgi:hypothetical protein